MGVDRRVNERSIFRQSYRDKRLARAIHGARKILTDCRIRLGTSGRIERNRWGFGVSLTSTKSPPGKVETTRGVSRKGAKGNNHGGRWSTVNKRTGSRRPTEVTRHAGYDLPGPTSVPLVSYTATAPYFSSTVLILLASPTATSCNASGSRYLRATRCTSSAVTAMIRVA